MATLVTIETIALILLALLVAGLLRSHAEILRRLETDGRAPRGEGAIDPSLPPARESATPAFDVAGTTLDGEPIKTAVATGRTNTLLVFLSSGCLSCRAIWQALAPARRVAPPGNARIVVVTKDTTHESPTKLRELAPPDLPVVMSSDAWESYGVQGSPYFIFVEGVSGRVIGEGTASDWSQVLSLLSDALDDAEHAERPSAEAVRSDATGHYGDTPAERLRRADDELRAAGIGPGHPSLYARGNAVGDDARAEEVRP